MLNGIQGPKQGCRCAFDANTYVDPFDEDTFILLTQIVFADDTPTCDQTLDAVETNFMNG
jgi:hypothetical protein